MIKSTKINYLVLFLCVLLAACGGGGGGAASDTKVSVTGAIGKGLFINAAIRAYELRDGQLYSLGSDTTDAKGEFKLSIQQTNNPIIIELTTTQDTTMLDETNGFQPVSVVPGIKLRTLLTDAAGINALTVHGNLFTEMAVDAAMKMNGGMTKSAAAAAKAMMQQTVGFDPFTTKPIRSSSETMDGNQVRLMTLSTALLFNAKDRKASCNTDSTMGLACEIERLNTKANISYSNETFTLSDGPNLVSDLLEKLQTFANMPTNDPFMSMLKSRTSVVAAGLSAPAPMSASSAIYLQDLTAFLTGMRDAIIQTGETLKSRVEEVKTRVDQYVLQGTTDGVTVFIQLLANSSCTFQDIFSCDTNGTGLTSNGSGYSFEFFMDENGNRVELSDSNAKLRVTGTISASTDSYAGVFDFDVSAQRTVIATGAKISEIRFGVNATSMSSDTNLATFTLNHLTAKVYDQRPASTNWAYFSLSGLNFVVNRDSNLLQTTTLAIPLVLSTSEGDQFTGTLEKLIFKERVVDPDTQATRTFPSEAIISVSAVSKSGPVLGLTVTATQDLNTYNPALNSTVDNPKNFFNLLIITLDGKETLRLTETKTRFDETSIEVRVSANGQWFSLAGLNKRTNPVLGGEKPYGDYLISSSGPFHGRIRTQPGGSIAGEIFKGNTQVGVIVDGVAMVGGVEISLN